MRAATLLERGPIDHHDRDHCTPAAQYQPVPVAQDVPQQTIFYLEEHHDLFPGVSYEIDPIRSYPDRKRVFPLRKSDS